MAPSVKCESCGKTLVISDDVYQRRIQGRVVQVRCKGCNASIRVDGRVGADEETAELEPDDDDPSERRVLPGAAEVWAVDFDETGHRELNAEQIREALQDGSITRHTLVWTVGLDTWVPIAKVPALARLLPAGLPASSPVGLRPQQPTLAGFGDIPRSRPKAESSPKAAQKPAEQVARARPARGGAGGIGMRRGATPEEVPSARTTLLGLNSATALHPIASAEHAESLDADVREVSEWESTAEELDGGAFEGELTTTRADLDSENDSTKVYESESSPYSAPAPQFPLSGRGAAHGVLGAPASHPSASGAAFGLGSAPAAQPYMNGSNGGAPTGSSVASAPFAGNLFEPPPSKSNATLSNPFMSGAVAAPPAGHSGSPSPFQQTGTPSPFQRSGTPSPFQQAGAPTGSGAFAASAVQAELERLAESSVPEKSRAPLFVAISAVALVGIGLAVVATSAKPPLPTVSIAPPAPTAEVRRSNNTLAADDAGGSSTKDAAGDFTKTFKAGAGIAGATISDAGQPASTFRSELALAALRQAEPKARACYRVGGPTRAEIVVRFQPSGRASQVRATGELAGTKTGMCLVSAFSDLEIASFQGSAQEFRGDVSLQ